MDLNDISIMKEQVKRTLFAAVLRLLRPLVRILLRHGIPFNAFSDLARWVYVDLAAREFGVAGRKQTNSRISIITGLSRKEVLRLRRMKEPVDAEAFERYNRAARVVSGWIRDRRFLKADGRPRILPFDTGKANFSLLVKDFSGDVPARAVLDELLHVEAVDVMKDRKIRLLSRAYVPRGGQPEQFVILGTDVADLIRTIDHNIAGNERFLQRKVSYDNIPEKAISGIRKQIKQQGQNFLERINAWLSREDRDVNPAVGGTGRWKAGVGIFYFEEDLEAETASIPALKPVRSAKPQGQGKKKTTSATTT